MFDWLKRLLHGNKRDEAAAKDGPGENKRKEKYRDEPGMITRTCKKCGKTFTLPENVQHWPDYCLECRAKYQPVEMITRKCRGCGKEFSFPSNVRHWPNFCRECQAKRKR